MLRRIPNNGKELIDIWYNIKWKKKKKKVIQKNPKWSYPLTWQEGL